MEKADGSRLLGRSRRRRKYNIKTDLTVVECGGMDLIDLVRDRDRWPAVVNAVMNLLIP